MRLISTPRKIGKTFKNAARLRTIASVFAKYGFQNIAERIKLGRFLMERFTHIDTDQYTPAERIRMAFEELGPTFVKMGQVLAMRPDLIPDDLVEEFKKLHDQAASLPFAQIQKVMEGQFGVDVHKIFTSIDPVPLAAASIAQVHRARLVGGQDVVVKVQRPGIAEVIKDDIGIMYFLADLLRRYVPETRLYNPVGIVDEFSKTLELETNFVVEANNLRRFHENFKTDPTVKIPQVYFQYSGPRVLVLEALEGVPLSNRHSLEQEGVQREAVIRTGIRAYFQMVFRDGLFHGDLHAGNLFIMPNSQIGLVDFGIVGRLNRRTRDAIANMFVALYSEDYERLAYEYVELAPYNDLIDVDTFAKDLRDLLAPYFGLSTKNVDLGRLLMDTTRVAAKHHLVLPSELVLFFKSIMTVEGMGRMVMEDFDLLQYALEFASELVKAKYEPKRIREDLLYLARDSTGMLYALPRQIKQFIRKVNHPDFAVRMSMVELEELKHSLETSSNIVFLGIIIGALVVGSSITMSITNIPLLFNMPWVAAIGYLIAIGLSFVAFYNYIKK